MNCLDIIGPVMIGPSSSHTAGACRIGKVANALLSEPVSGAFIEFYGSFAKTYCGHGTDKAIVAGILGMDPDDMRLKDSFLHAREANVSIQITTAQNDDLHPNTASVTLYGRSGKSVSVQGASIGGGEILIERINGMEVSVSGQHTTLVVLHKDAPGVIAAVTRYVGQYQVNICNFRLSRESKGGEAVMTIELDGEIKPQLTEQIDVLPNVIHSILLHPLAKQLS